ncbi:MAG TPA: aspartate aminotransferase family protein, partial [Microthrixaceae bacterium]|nr:aspartate aminotransferase family protein [Microthrixaceae bacterium]HQF93878.1 aspartate aminotransferase family protein [Microthrixaceae bacterium]
MHHFDETTERILQRATAYVRERLSFEPVPLDHRGDAATLDREAPSLIGESGNDPDLVFDQYEHILSPAVISVDSPRFLSFIPAAPTKASMLFDMVVSASSLNGTSWLES